MEVKRGVKAKVPDQPLTLAIGEFDGFHPGHRKIINRTLELSSQTNTRSAALTFEKKYPALNTTDEKLRLLGDCGLKLAVVMPLGGKWKNWSPEYFVDEFLIRRLQTRHLIVGRDFKFGRNRSGNTETLKLLERPGFKPHVLSLKKKNARKISSSQIRELLKSGKLQQCRQLLGRNYSFTGKIIPGKQLGRKLGFPTLNFSVPPEKILPKGVFLCRALIDKEQQDPAYYGTCFIDYDKENQRKKAEIHFLESMPPDKTKILGAELLKKISRVKTFSKPRQLIKKISSDVQKAKEFLATGDLT